MSAKACLLKSTLIAAEKRAAMLPIQGFPTIILTYSGYRGTLLHRSVGVENPVSLLRPGELITSGPAASMR
jgi:hypothetical protein